MLNLILVFIGSAIGIWVGELFIVGLEEIKRLKKLQKKLKQQLK